MTGHAKSENWNATRAVDWGTLHGRAVLYCGACSDRVIEHLWDSKKAIRGCNIPGPKCSPQTSRPPGASAWLTNGNFFTWVWFRVFSDSSVNVINSGTRIFLFQPCFANWFCLNIFVFIQTITFFLQLHKVNAVTLADWLKHRGIAVKSKDKKSDLTSKVKQYLALVLHEQ